MSRYFKKWKVGVMEHLEDLKKKKIILKEKLNSNNCTIENKLKYLHLEKLIKLNEKMIKLFLK